MKKCFFLFCLAISLNSKAETLRSLYDQEFFGATNNILIVDKGGHVIALPNGFGVLTNDIFGNYGWAVMSGGSPTNWSTFPAVQDVAMAGFTVEDAATVSFQGGGFINGVEWDNASLSAIVIDPTSPNFGVHNGEPAGVGANINFVSDNGAVQMSSLANTARIDGETNGSLPYAAGLGTALTVSNSIAQGQIWFGNVSPDRGAIDMVPELANPNAGLRVAIYDGLFGGDVNTAFVQCSPGPNGYGVLEAPSGLGMILGTGNGATPVMFAVNRSEVGRFDSDGRFLVGYTNDDGSNAAIQSANDISAFGSYWAAGQQGFTGTLADAITGGKNVVGGIVVQ